MNHEQFAIWATMEALPGKEDDAREFLREAARRLGSEPGTTNFYALEIGDGKFAIFNMFIDEAALQAHVNGDVANWVRDSREGLFVRDYDITRTEVITTTLAEMAQAKQAV